MSIKNIDHKETRYNRKKNKKKTVFCKKEEKKKTSLRIKSMAPQKKSKILPEKLPER